MPAPFSILAIDLHNTLYDEVAEYGLAIDEAVSLWIEEARRRMPIERETLYRELASAHRRCGSDWDAEVWRELPSLARLGYEEKEFDRIMRAAETCRRKKSRELTVAGAYKGMLETLTALKAGGARIFVMTEASADAGMSAVRWLKLAGVADGVYSYPSRIPVQPLRGTFHKAFPPAPDGSHLKKPHPLILATLTLDEAIRRGDAPEDTPADDVFGIEVDKNLLIPELAAAASMQADTASRLILKDTPFKAALDALMAQTLFVGDSKFKDGMLARNAGVAFGHAAYGKKIHPGREADHARSLAVMYAVTGWDEEVMKLTQEASHSAAVETLTPDYVFQDSLSEVLGLFITK